MATVQLLSSLNMLTASTWYGTIVAYNSAQIEIENGSLIGTYYGNFSYDTQGDVFGTLTGFTETYTGIPILSITGLNVSASTAEQLIQDNELQQLFQLALTGDDQFIVTPGTHVIDGYGGYNTVTEPFAYSQYTISNGGTSLKLMNSTSNDTLYNIQGVYFSNGFYDVQNGSFSSNSGLLGSLTVNQQLELIYIAYFNRAADSGGFTFWQQQYDQYQASGEPTETVVTNIANGFAPQPETEALYPSLDPYVGTTNPPPLNTTAGEAALSTFIGSVYTNLFDRAPDPVGETYWVGQIASGAVAIGAAALAIANGATGADVTSLQNSIAAALAATNPSGTSGTVLSGVDATSLNGASVTAGMAATTASLSDTSISASTAVTTSAVTGSTTSPASPATGSVDVNVITIAGSNQLINPGAGSYTIQFLAGASADTLVLGTGGVDQLSGFNSGTDVLDFSSLLGAADVNLNGNFAALGNYVTIADQGADALVRFDPTGHGSGSTVAVLQGLGSTVTGLDTLVAQGAIRIA
jgi:hypothetical protein